MPETTTTAPAPTPPPDPKAAWAKQVIEWRRERQELAHRIANSTLQGLANSKDHAIQILRKELIEHKILVATTDASQVTALQAQVDSLTSQLQAAGQMADQARVAANNLSKQNAELTAQVDSLKAQLAAAVPTPPAGS